MTFIMAGLFFVWRLTPAGFLGLPPSYSYAAIWGSAEGRMQSEVSKASADALAKAEQAKAEAVSPIEIKRQLAIASQSAPIEIEKTVTITAEQAKIEQVKTCRQTMMQGAGQAYAQCVGGGYETGVACEARRDLILERYGDCGTLPGEKAPEGADENAGGIR